MIEMKVMGIALDTRTGSPIVVLHDKQNRRALPIWIGSAEASAIIRKIENLNVVRPMTHDLIPDIIQKTGYKLDRVEINDVEQETYYATLFLTKGDEVIEIDSRPSDAIAVAIRVDAPIFVTANVLSNGSVSTDSAVTSVLESGKKSKLHIEVISGPVKILNDTTFQVCEYEAGWDNPRRCLSVWMVAVAEPDGEHKGAVLPININLPANVIESVRRK